jgi:hypothetical protein
VSEKTITQDEVRQEHLAEVSSRAHWFYLFAVLGGSFLLMIGLLALLSVPGS